MSTETVETQVSLESYQDKRVILTTINPEDPEGSIETEGKVEAANDLGILIKPKGKSQVEMFEADKILQVVLAPEKEKGVSKKHLQPIELGHARQHLADRHGITLSELKNYTEDAAFAAHKQIDHADLGHDHNPKPKQEKPADGAPAEAESNSEDNPENSVSAE